MKYPTSAKLQCPHCLGKGYIEVRAGRQLINESTAEKQKKLKEIMKRADYKELSLREIGRLTGIGHPQKVKYHLSRM